MITSRFKRYLNKYVRIRYGIFSGDDSVYDCTCYTRILQVDRDSTKGPFVCIPDDSSSSPWKAGEGEEDWARWGHHPLVIEEITKDQFEVMYQIVGQE